MKSIKPMKIHQIWFYLVNRFFFINEKSKIVQKMRDAIKRYKLTIFIFSDIIILLFIYFCYTLYVLCLQKREKSTQQHISSTCVEQSFLCYIFTAFDRHLQLKLVKLWRVMMMMVQAVQHNFCEKITFFIWAFHEIIAL